MTGRDNREKAAQAEQCLSRVSAHHRPQGQERKKNQDNYETVHNANANIAPKRRKHRAKTTAFACREHADSIFRHARRTGLVWRARLCSSCSCASHDGSRGAEIGPGIIWAGHLHGRRGNWRQQGCGNLTFVVSSCSVCIWSNVSRRVLCGKSDPPGSHQRATRLYLWAL